MKRQWRIRRHFRVATDGTRRWDQAYQLLLEWAQASLRTGAPLPVMPPSPVQEEEHEHGDLCPRVNRATSSGADH